MSEKSLCKWDEKKIEKKTDKYFELVNDAKYLCKKCGRVAVKEKYLCKPVSLPDNSN